MSFEDVSQRLNELQESNRQLRDLIERLATLKFQAGSIPLKDEEDNSVMGELKSEIQQIIREQFDDFAILEEDVKDLKQATHNSELLAQKSDLEQAVSRAEKELKGLQIEYRKAVLTARDNLKAAKRAEYLLLVNSAFDPKTRSNTSSPVPGQRRNEKKAALTQEEREVNASRDVTLALRRTHDIMASELSRSQFAHDILNESTLALKELGETYSVLDTMLSSSKNLLGTLLRSQKSDTWYLETAFYVLSGTIAWLLFRRLLYGPLWWLLWFPLRIFFRSLIGVLTGIGLIGGGAADGISSAASSISGTQLVVHNSATRASRPTMAHGGHSINVGGGGKGGPVRPRERPQGQEGETLSEQVGQIIEDSPNEKPSQRVPDGAADRARQADAQPNPKKRMWEEENEEVKEDRSSKDEL